MSMQHITCPQCGKLLCRALIGSFVEVYCSNCKTLVQGKVDNDGGVHALPLLVKPVKKQCKI